jgi:hemoglobin-like flavoprotein
MTLNLHALEESFDAVAPRGDELMEEFYSRLFEATPAVRPLFAHTDMKRRKRCS